MGDVSPKPPVLTAPDGQAEGGRGLLLVRELSARWGTYWLPEGKIVWSAIAVPSHLVRDRGPRPVVSAGP